MMNFLEKYLATISQISASLYPGFQTVEATSVQVTGLKRCLDEKHHRACNLSCAVAVEELIKAHVRALSWLRRRWLRAAGDGER